MCGRIDSCAAQKIINFRNLDVENAACRFFAKTGIIKSVTEAYIRWTGEEPIGYTVPKKEEMV